MYLPDSFRQDNPEAIRDLIDHHPLATLVTISSGAFEANHLPLLFIAPSDTHPQGTLLGHIARANPLWQASPANAEALAIFQGPAHYITPNWYPSKREHGRAVPTWNYTAVHIHGKLAFHHDPAWLLGAVTLLTNHQEASLRQPWQVADAPAEYTAGLLKAIVGIELHITRIEAKWKVSQNRSEEDRIAVAAELEKLESREAGKMAELVRQRLPEPSE